MLMIRDMWFVSYSMAGPVYNPHVHIEGYPRGGGAQPYVACSPYSCTPGGQGVNAIIGAASSGLSMSAALVTAKIQVPQISLPASYIHY